MTPEEIVQQVLERHGVTREEVCRPGNIRHKQRAARYDIAWSLHSAGMRCFRIAPILNIDESGVSKIVRHVNKFNFKLPDPIPVDAGLRCMPDLREKIVAVLLKHKVTWREVSGPLRSRYLIAPRYEVFTLLRGRGWSLPRIGKFCNRDHTTILHHLRFNAPKATDMREAA